MKKETLNNWYDEGQKKQKVNLGIPPKTSAWEAFIIWGQSSDFMNSPTQEQEQQSKLYAQQIGLL